MSDTVTALQAFISGRSNLFVVLDAARNSKISDYARDYANESRSLFSGSKAKELANVSPYLFQLDPENDASTALLEWYFQTGLGESYGIFVESLVPFNELREHLRSFYIVQLPSGKEALFRFYDPRVFGAYLDSCPPSSLHSLFGDRKIASFVFERDFGDSYISFQFSGKVLIKQSLTASITNLEQ